MKPSHLLRASLLLAAVTLQAGCFRTIISSGRWPAAPPHVEYDAKWHSGVIYGIAELSGPYNLTAACPEGWSTVTTETSFLNGLVQSLTYSIYNPQTVTIQCAEGVPTAPPPSPAPAPSASR